MFSPSSSSNLPVATKNNQVKQKMKKKTLHKTKPKNKNIKSSDLKPNRLVDLIRGVSNNSVNFMNRLTSNDSTSSVSTVGVDEDNVSMPFFSHSVENTYGEDSSTVIDNKNNIVNKQGKKKTRNKRNNNTSIKWKKKKDEEKDKVDAEDETDSLPYAKLLKKRKTIQYDENVSIQTAFFT